MRRRTRSFARVTADPPLCLSLLLVFGAAPAVAVGAPMALHALLGRLLRG